MGVGVGVGGGLLPGQFKKNTRHTKTESQCPWSVGGCANAHARGRGGASGCADVFIQNTGCSTSKCSAIRKAECHRCTYTGVGGVGGLFPFASPSSCSFIIGEKCPFMNATSKSPSESVLKRDGRSSATVCGMHMSVGRIR